MEEPSRKINPRHIRRDMVDEFPVPESFNSSFPSELDASFVDGSDESSSEEDSGGGGSEEEGVVTATKASEVPGIRRGGVSGKGEEERESERRRDEATTHQIEATRIMRERPMAAPIPLPMLGAGSPGVVDRRGEGKGVSKGSIETNERRELENEPLARAVAWSLTNWMIHLTRRGEHI